MWDILKNASYIAVKIEKRKGKNLKLNWRTNSYVAGVKKVPHTLCPH
jgi:hypothetical protein